MIRYRIKEAGPFIHAFLPALVIILWIDAYVWLTREERYRAFLQPKLFPLLIIGTCILLLFLIPFILKEKVSENRRPSKDMWARIAVLCLPIIFLYATYGQGLGIDALSKRKLDYGPGIQTPFNTQKNPSPNSRFDRSMTLLELVRNLNRLNGKQIVTSGSVYRDSSVPEGYIMLFQFVITCCAADAQPIWVLVKTPLSGALANESWIKVNGKLGFELNRENRIPVIEARTLHRIPTPPVEKRYLYF